MLQDLQINIMQSKMKQIWRLSFEVSSIFSPLYDIKNIFYVINHPYILAGCHQRKFTGDSGLSPVNFRW